MNKRIDKYINETPIQPEVLALLHVIMNYGTGIPKYMLAEYETSVNLAQSSGYIILVNDKIYPTRKANKFVHDLLQLAAETGEIDE